MDESRDERLPSGGIPYHDLRFLVNELPSSTDTRLVVGAPPIAKVCMGDEPHGLLEFAYGPHPLVRYKSPNSV